MLILGKLQISKTTPYKYIAAKKGSNRNDLTAKRRADFKIKLSKMLGTFNFSFFYIKSSDFSRTLGDKSASFKLYKSKYLAPKDKNNRSHIKKSSFKIARRFLSTTKKAFFKHFAKRRLFSNRVLTFNKIWQKQFVHKFSKNFYPFASTILAKYKRDLKTISHFTKKNTESESKKLMFSAKNPLLLMVMRHFFGNVSLGFCLHILENSFCRVNGGCVTDPFYRLKPFSILTFNFFPSYHILVLLLSRRFLRRKTKSTTQKSKLKKYPMSGIYEVNFKNGEILFLPTTANKNLPSSFFFKKQEMDSIFLQRVFKKQQKFGLKE